MAILAEEKNLGAAFALTCMAGASTVIGASVVFFPKLVKRASPRVLAASLGLSAGVMVYLSFVEVFIKSVNKFVSSGAEERHAYFYATLSFFGGVSMMKAIEICIRYISRPDPVRREIEEDIEITWNENEDCENENAQQEDAADALPHYCVGCSDDPVAQLEQWHELAELELQGVPQKPPPIQTITTWSKRTSSMESIPVDEESGAHAAAFNADGSQQNILEENVTSTDVLSHDQPIEEKNLKHVVVQVQNIPRSQEEDGFFRAPTRVNIHPKEEMRKLVKMGFNTTFCILLHNFPEGLATFVAALDDPSIGAVLAVAISLHNIPEGLCVALPIYYATGDRWRAFRWGCLAGISEPIAALLGWLVLASVIKDEVYGALFGLVSGMMVMISLKELIPSAHRYDPEDTVVTHSILVGMTVIGISIVLIQL